MSQDCSPVAAIALIGAGALLFGFHFVMLRNKREAEHLPTSACRAVPMGLVEVAGRAQGVSFPSPFAGIPCLCSRLVVEEWREDTRGNHWHELYGKTFSTPFYVEDGTGRVRVDPDEADLHLEPDYSYDMAGGLDADPAALDRLQTAGFDAERVRTRLAEFGANRAGAVGEATAASQHREPTARGDLTAQVFARGLSAARILQDLPRLLLSRKPRRVRGTKPLRMREDNLCPGDEVYVLGTATAVEGAGTEGDRIVIRRGELHPWFAIGERSQKETLLRMMRNAWVVPLAGVLLILAGMSMLGDCLFAAG